MTDFRAGSPREPGPSVVTLTAGKIGYPPLQRAGQARGLSQRRRGRQVLASDRMVWYAPVSHSIVCATKPTLARNGVLPPWRWNGRTGGWNVDRGRLRVVVVNLLWWPGFEFLHPDLQISNTLEELGGCWLTHGRHSIAGRREGRGEGAE